VIHANEDSLASCFEAIAEQFSSRLAYRDNALELTYQELNSRANCVASRLINANIIHGSPVSILASGGLNQVVGMLGTLKAGCCGFVIDPINPDARATQILEHSRAEALICDNSCEPRAALLARTSQTIINIEGEVDCAIIGNPKRRNEPSDGAVVIYTSGSTGNPKGVLHSHDSLMHNVARHAKEFSIIPEDRQTLLYQLSVYGGIRDMFNALLNGASLHYLSVRDAGVQMPAQWLVTVNISIYCSVASVLRELCSAVPKGTTIPLGFPAEDVNVSLLDEDGSVVSEGTIGRVTPIGD
jgi:non-ribosomal peptide synthetase component F